LFELNGSVLSKADGLQEKAVSIPVERWQFTRERCLAETIQNAVNTLSKALIDAPLVLLPQAGGNSKQDASPAFPLVGMRSPGALLAQRSLRNRRAIIANIFLGVN
jgi:hypothetical protein